MQPSFRTWTHRPPRTPPAEARPPSTAWLFPCATGRTWRCEVKVFESFLGEFGKFHGKQAVFNKSLRFFEKFFDFF